MKDEWLLKLDKALKREIEKPPKNYYSRNQLEKKWKCTGTHVRRILLAMRQRNMIEIKTFTLLNSEGHFCKIPHYKLKK